MNKTLSVTGTGDALFTADFPPEYDAGIKPVADFIRACDIRMTNLETNLSGFDRFAFAVSGGTWLNTPPSCLKDLLRFGFNFFGTANNHAMDYAYGGLLSTLEVLDGAHLAHAGTGTSLEEAAKPAVIEANGQKIAVFAVDASCRETSRAGNPSGPIPARPGVNFLRHSAAYKISAEDREALARIARKTGINFIRQLNIDTGYLSPDPPDAFVLGDLHFTTSQEGPVTRCDPKDRDRLLTAFRLARKTCDQVFLMIHCHDCDNRRNENPPDYLVEFVHAAAEAGVSAVFGGGCHRLRGLEICHGCPVFYSLGDFIYQGMTVRHLPADFKEKYGIPLNASAPEALFLRSRGGTVGLHLQKENFQTLLPRIEFENGKMTSLVMMPVYLSFDRRDEMNGLPVQASGAEAREIFEIIRTLSAPYGTRMNFENGLIRVEI